jgi:hypothetical protein
VFFLQVCGERTEPCVDFRFFVRIAGIHMSLLNEYPHARIRLMGSSMREVEMHQYIGVIETLKKNLQRHSSKNEYALECVKRATKALEEALEFGQIAISHDFEQEIV